MNNQIAGITPSLKWLSDLLSFFQAETIKIPSEYRDRVLSVKDLLDDDSSGLVNSMLDFAIGCATKEYMIESDNDNLTEVLNTWLDEINNGLSYSVPPGIVPLAKEYLIERWKRSSNLLLRIFWEEKDGFELPMRMFFVHGEDIKCKTKEDDNQSATNSQKQNKVILLGSEKYYLRISNDPKDDLPLPNSKNESIFVRKPYERWGTKYSVPFLIKRGIYRNLSFLKLMSQKGEYIVGKALEYLLIIKKGTESLAREGRSEFIYSEEDLKKVSNDLSVLIQNKKSDGGIPTYTTNFDTAMEHFIPDYSRAINDTIYSPIEKRILGGLGLVEILEGIGTTRRESILNPKPFRNEIESAVADFKALINDIIREIIKRNIQTHKKYFGSKIEIYSPPITEFLDYRIKQLLRSLYDRGKLSAKTLTEVVGESKYNLEVKRRIEEKRDNHDIIMYPPVIQNQEGQTSPEEEERLSLEFPEDTEMLEEKLGPEAKNYYMSNGEYEPEVTKNYIRLRQKDPDDFQKDSFRIITLSKSKGIKAVIGRLTSQETATVQSYLFIRKLWTLKKAQDWVKRHKGSEEELLESSLEEDKILEEAPYTKDNPPASIKNLPAGARSIWITVFNKNYSKGEETARKIAWYAVKQVYKKVDDKWIRKNKGELEDSFKQLDFNELLELKKLEILGKQEKVLKQLLEEKSIDQEPILEEDSNETP